MLTLKDISARYDLSPKQARRYLESVSHLISSYCQRGPHNTTLVSQQAIPVFDRLTELLRDGLSLPAASQQISKEMNGNGKTDAHLTVDSWQTNGQPYRDELLGDLRAQVQDLRQERERLLRLLEESQLQVRQLMLPAPKPALSQQSMSRWVALRVALLGR